MGLDAAASAVDPRGETWEVEGLYVADASTFPTALGVNPMVTVQAIAYCTAQSVLQVLRRSKKEVVGRGEGTAAAAAVGSLTKDPAGSP